MRVLLVCHALASQVRTGVELHTDALARALARRGAQVHLFAPRRATGCVPLAQRSHEVDGVGVTELSLPRGATFEEGQGPPAMADAFRALLERERPDVVHFQHVRGLGLAPLRVAAEADLPTIYHAQDFYPLGPNPTLLLPDLSPQLDLDDRGYARLAAARAFLDGLPALGDHHGSVLLEELGAGERARLARILREDAPGVRTGGIAAWRASFAAVGRLSASSAYLARRLRAALERDVGHRPAGIETAALARVARERPIDARRGRLRVGYFGALLKHKGAHWLLDAWEPLATRFELQIHGSSRDHVYRRALARRAERVGASLRGGYSPEDLPERLAGVDLVVVPSLWSENAPFVIREAFAAGRPVLAPGTEALAESVRAGVDGLLFEPGDPASLRATLESLDRDRPALERLCAGIAPVLDVDEEARAWIEEYGELLARSGSRAPGEPAEAELPSVSGLARRLRALEALPSAELERRLFAGWSRLSSLLGVAHRPQHWLRQALTGGSRSRDLLAEGSRQAAWLEGSLAQREAELASLDARARWLEGRVDFAERHRDELALALEERAAALAALERERDWLRGLCADREQELAWRRSSLAQRESELRESGRARSHTEHALESARRELEWLRGTIADRDAELHWLRERLLRAEAVAVECAWRAREMEAARRAAHGRAHGLLGGALVRRARGWPPLEEGRRGAGAGGGPA